MMGKTPEVRSGERQGLKDMMISTKGRYALRVMIELASGEEGELISLKEIAQSQDISEKYLESIVKNLVKAGFVAGLRGKGGGYRLACPAAQCTVGGILRAAEGSVAPVACVEGDAKPCPRREHCAALPVWTELNRRIDEYLDSVTLEQVVRQAREAASPQG